jgi:hypothetical protein
VFRNRHARADVCEPREVDGRKGYARPFRVGQARHDAAPGVYNERVPVTLSLEVVLSRLRCRNDVALALDCARPEKHLPVRLACARRFISVLQQRLDL